MSQTPIVFINSLWRMRPAGARDRLAERAVTAHLRAMRWAFSALSSGASTTTTTCNGYSRLALPSSARKVSCGACTRALTAAGVPGRPAPPRIRASSIRCPTDAPYAAASLSRPRSRARARSGRAPGWGLATGQLPDPGHLTDLVPDQLGRGDWSATAGRKGESGRFHRRFPRYGRQQRYEFRMCGGVRMRLDARRPPRPARWRRWCR